MASATALCISAARTGPVLLGGIIRAKAVQGGYLLNSKMLPVVTASSVRCTSENLQKEIKPVKDKIFPAHLEHFLSEKSVDKRKDIKKHLADVESGYNLPHPIWSKEELNNVVITHKNPNGIVEHLSYFSVQLMRKSFDALSGFNRKERDEHVWLNRICFLETVAGVPGMVAAMVRHLNSLRRLKRDHGWIHTLLEEAENERMHLMTALQLKQPSVFFRASVILAQGVFVTLFSFSYLLSPRFCHGFVGYLEEEAVKTYSKCLEDIDSGKFRKWKVMPAPELAVSYWKLHPKSTMRDVILAIRADEAHHRLVNHTLSSMKEYESNPYKPGE